MPIERLRRLRRLRARRLALLAWPAVAAVGGFVLAGDDGATVWRAAVVAWGVGVGAWIVVRVIYAFADLPD